MNTRLSQDALETLQAYEQQQKWRQRVLADRDRSNGYRIVGTWAPELTEQERQEREQQIKAGALPF